MKTIKNIFIKGINVKIDKLDAKNRYGYYIDYGKDWGYAKTSAEALRLAKKAIK